MAGRERLKVRPSIRFAALVAVVIATHAWLLQWLAQALEIPEGIRPMATPMFTRLLQPEAPKAAQPAAARPPPRKTRETRAAARVRPAKPAAKPASAPAPVPEPVDAAAAAALFASAPQPAASTPVAAASAAPAASSPASAASAPAVASLDSWPVDTRLSYRLTGWYRGEIGGSARVQWLRQDDRYEARVDLDLGLVGMHFLSQGTVSAESLSPRAYQETRPNRIRVVQIGPDSIVLNDGRTVPKPPAVQDTASHFVELSHRFATGQQKLAVGGTTSVWLARPGGVDLWTYDIVGLDPLATARYGTIEAFHLRPRPIRDARGDIYVEIWIAPSLQYLPVRIRITQGADSWVDILVDRIEQR